MNEELEKLTKNVLNHILRQIDRDGTELAALQPIIDWHERVATTARKFVPVVVENAAGLIKEVEQKLNSPQTVRAIWNDLKNQLQDDRLEKLKKSVLAMDLALTQEEELLSVITGETVSKLIADFLCRALDNLAQNNRSTYPDLYFTDISYSSLPRRSRDLAKGPALRGDNPTSIPDGIEIKSNNGVRIRVDSHHPHQGLHLALTFSSSNKIWRVYDVYLAYLSEKDYTRATRRTTATTDKFSFGHTPFISATTGSTRQGELILEESTL